MTELKIKNGIMKSVFITFDQAFYERILAHNLLQVIFLNAVVKVPNINVHNEKCK